MDILLLLLPLFFFNWNKDTLGVHNSPGLSNDKNLGVDLYLFIYLFFGGAGESWNFYGA